MIRKILAIMLSCTLVLSLAVCGSGSGTDETGGNDGQEEDIIAEDEEFTPTIATGEFQGYFFFYDASWRTQLSDDGDFFYLYPTDNNADGLVMLQYEEASIENKEEFIISVAEAFVTDEFTIESTYNYETNIFDGYARNVKYTQLLDETIYSVDHYIVADGDCGVLTIGLYVPEDSSEDYTDGFYKVLYSIDRFLDDYGDYPDENIDEIDEEVSDGIDYFYIYLDYSDEWDSLGFADQTDLAEACVKYCAQRAERHYGISQTKIGIFAFTDDGQSAFTYDGGSEVRIFTNNRYDYSYNLP